MPITSTRALTNVTLAYVEQLADLGSLGAVAANPELARGVNTLGGRVTYEAVAEAHGMEYTPLDDALAAGVVESRIDPSSTPTPSGVSSRRTSMAG